MTFDLGTKDKDKDKTYVRVEGWPRVNAVDDSVLKLARRPEYAYRNRQVLDIAAADVKKIEIQRGPESYGFGHERARGSSMAPVQADVDVSKVTRLVDELGRLNVAEFITDKPSPQDLEKVYGLAKPALTARLVLADPKKTASTLSIGKAKGDKEFYARLNDGPIFVVKKDLHEQLDRGSLAYLSLDVLREPKEKMRELAIQKGGQDYRLVNDGKTWKVRGPFAAPAQSAVVDPMVEALADLHANRYVAHEAKDAKEYGLDKPYLTVRLVPTAKEDAEHQLLIGKTADKDADRFAKLAQGSAIFVVPAKTVAALDHGPLDFLDKKLVDVDTKTIQKMRVTGANAFTLARKKDLWDVVDSPAPTFVAEEDAVQNALRPWTRLQAARVAAYGPKIDWATFGLDKPAASSR